jgi:hypothetical protein
MIPNFFIIGSIKLWATAKADRARIGRYFTLLTRILQAQRPLKTGGCTQHRPFCCQNMALQASLWISGRAVAGIEARLYRLRINACRCFPLWEFMQKKTILAILCLESQGFGEYCLFLWAFALAAIAFSI